MSAFFDGKTTDTPGSAAGKLIVLWLGVAATFFMDPMLGIGAGAIMGVGTAWVVFGERDPGVPAQKNFAWIVAAVVVVACFWLLGQNGGGR